MTKEEYLEIAEKYNVDIDKFNIEYEKIQSSSWETMCKELNLSGICLNEKE